MKITIFTSNSLRHISLVNKLSSLGHKCYVVIENKSKEIYKKIILKINILIMFQNQKINFLKGIIFIKKIVFL